MRWQGGGRKVYNGCWLRAQVLVEALKISRPLILESEEVPGFHGGSLWHFTPV